MVTFPIYDAHNHLHDARLKPYREEIFSVLQQIPVRNCVVNGTCEEDWAEVQKLSAEHRWIIPAYGLHPWHAKNRSADWEKSLDMVFESSPCVTGEIGLDRWIPDFDPADQEQVFVTQLRLARSRGLPVMIHCLRAWGRLLEILRSEFSNNAGFLMHSYGGSEEMLRELADLGGYFSISGYFFHERKARQRELFTKVPRDRLLIETDAPDMHLPPKMTRYQLPPSEGKEVNHPGNIVPVYEQAARLLGLPLDELATQVESNFRQLFGPVL